MNRAVAFWIAVLMFMAGLTALALAFRNSRDRIGESGNSGPVDLSYLRSPDVKPGEWLKEFTLTERSGRKVSSRELLGKPYIASFFYTSCPTECLQQNAKMQELANEFKGTDFVFLSITCDPASDHPARLREYADKFHADPKQWLFLTGDLEYLKRVASEMYFVPFEVKFHAARFIAVDRNGVLRKHFAWQQPAQMTELRKVMKELLAEEAKPVTDPPQPMPPPSDEPQPTPSGNEEE